tara:strand:+ start:1517 stop:1705 length:189 start_codon:yes stop_codon:yes gene_type:complete
MNGNKMTRLQQVLEQKAARAALCKANRYIAVKEVRVRVVRHGKVFFDLRTIAEVAPFEMKGE